MQRLWKQSVKFSLAGLVLSGVSSVWAAYPTAVNNQITDSVTQDNVKVLGEAPAEGMANIYQTMAQSVDLTAQNAVRSQQQLQTRSTASAAAAEIKAIDAQDQGAAPLKTARSKRAAKA